MQPWDHNRSLNDEINHAGCRHFSRPDFANTSLAGRAGQYNGRRKLADRKKDGVAVQDGDSSSRRDQFNVLDFVLPDDPLGEPAERRGPDAPGAERNRDADRNQGTSAEEVRRIPDQIRDSPAVTSAARCSQPLSEVVGIHT